MGIIALVYILGNMSGCHHSAPTPVYQVVQSTGPTDMPSARTGGLLCSVNTVGLPSRFVPRDSGCPSRASATPPDVIADSSAPAPGIKPIAAPPVTDTANEQSDVNWSPIVRGHPGYTIFESIGGEIIIDTPDHHDPRIRIDCWDVLQNNWHVITTSWCNGSAFRYQSTSGQSLNMGYGFMPSARS